MKILLTGGSGFIGRNILPILREHHEVDAPTRAQMDVNDQSSVDTWLEHSPADVLIHCAIVDPGKPIDAGKGILQTMLQAFMNLVRHPFKKVIYVGSGAEYDKSRAICQLAETDMGQSIPADEYGLARYVINKLAVSSSHIYNLRVFGCYGPHEAERRFLRHAISCCRQGKPISLHQNCRFSYVYVEDLAHLMLEIMAHGAPHQDYNICPEQPCFLEDMARIVQDCMGTNLPVLAELPGLNKEYSGDNARLRSDFPHFRLTSMEEGVRRVIASLPSIYTES